MANREESREEWEKELIDVQHTVTFDEGLRASQIIAKKLSVTPAPVPDFAHLVRLLVSGALLTIGLLVFSTDVPHKTALGIASLAAGCCLGIAAFRWPHRHE
jgi:hypothetical protein